MACPLPSFRTYVLFCTAPYYTILHCTLQYCTALYSTVCSGCWHTAWAFPSTRCTLSPVPPLCLLTVPLQCQARGIDATLWCCGFADASPWADNRNSLDALAAVVQQLAPSLAPNLPKLVPPTAVTKALSVLKKKNVLPSDMYI